MRFDFPDFEGEAYFPGEKLVARLRKSDLLGKWAIFYFYPRDGTPGCTREALDFSERLEEVHRLGGEVVGVSTQSPESHRKFAEKYGLRHILLSDDGTLGRLLGILKESGTTERSTFLVTPEGGVARVWKKVKVPGHAEEVVGELKKLLSR
ncbi:MAG: peroxiredoxin [Candidatus Caldatribacteriaceae bacterium]